MDFTIEPECENTDLIKIPIEERGKIHASVVLPTLPVIIDKLIELALHRQATSLFVGVDFQTFTIHIEDNGEGWNLPMEIGKDTSNFCSGGYNFGWSKDIKRNERRGKENVSFKHSYSLYILQALRNVSSSIIITNRSKENPSSYTYLLKGSSQSSSVEMKTKCSSKEVDDTNINETYLYSSKAPPSKSLKSSGTIVTINDFFCSTPIRQKTLATSLIDTCIVLRNLGKKWKLLHPKLQIDIVTYSGTILNNGEFRRSEKNISSLKIIKKSSSGRMNANFNKTISSRKKEDEQDMEILFSQPESESLSSTFQGIFGINETRKVKEISFRFASLEVHGLLSTFKSSSLNSARDIQFIYLNHKYLCPIPLTGMKRQGHVVNRRQDEIKKTTSDKGTDSIRAFCLYEIINEIYIQAAGLLDVEVEADEVQKSRYRKRKAHSMRNVYPNLVLFFSIPESLLECIDGYEGLELLRGLPLLEEFVQCMLLAFIFHMYPVGLEKIKSYLTKKISQWLDGENLASTPTCENSMKVNDEIVHNSVKVKETEELMKMINQGSCKKLVNNMIVEEVNLLQQPNLGRTNFTGMSSKPKVIKEGKDENVDLIPANKCSLTFSVDDMRHEKKRKKYYASWLNTLLNFSNFQGSQKDAMRSMKSWHENLFSSQPVKYNETHKMVPFKNEKVISDTDTSIEEICIEDKRSKAAVIIEAGDLRKEEILFPRAFNSKVNFHLSDQPNWSEDFCQEYASENANKFNPYLLASGNPSAVAFEYTVENGHFDRPMESIPLFESPEKLNFQLDYPTAEITRKEGSLKQDVYQGWIKGERGLSATREKISFISSDYNNSPHFSSSNHRNKLSSTFWGLKFKESTKDGVAKRRKGGRASKNSKEFSYKDQNSSIIKGIEAGPEIKVTCRQPQVASPSLKRSDTLDNDILFSPDNFLEQFKYNGNEDDTQVSNYRQERHNINNLQWRSIEANEDYEDVSTTKDKSLWDFKRIINDDKWMASTNKLPNCGQNLCSCSSPCSGKKYRDDISMNVVEGSKGEVEFINTEKEKLSKDNACCHIENKSSADTFNYGCDLLLSRPDTFIKTLAIKTKDQEVDDLLGISDINNFSRISDHDFTQFHVDKLMLKNAQVISQVAYKFIIVVLKTNMFVPTSASGMEIDRVNKYESSVERWLCCIDQHAADERVRVERLMREVYGYAYGEEMNVNSSNNLLEHVNARPNEKNSALKANYPAYDKIGLDIARYRYKHGVINKVQILEYDSNNYPDLQISNPYYYRSRPGIIQRKITFNGLIDKNDDDIYLEDDDLYLLSLSHIQRLLAHWKFEWEYVRIRKENKEREITTKKGYEQDELLDPSMEADASDILLRVTAVPVILTVQLKSADLLTIARDYLTNAPGACTRHRQVERFKPRVVQQIINSRSCRYAIMFGDILTHEECSHLIGQLSECQYPFQCAHGRPSISPLCKLSSLYKEKLSSENKNKNILNTIIENYKKHPKGKGISSKLGSIYKIQNDYETFKRNSKI